MFTTRLHEANGHSHEPRAPHASPHAQTRHAADEQLPQLSFLRRVLEQIFGDGDVTISFRVRLSGGQVVSLKVRPAEAAPAPGQQAPASRHLPAPCSSGMQVLRFLAKHRDRRLTGPEVAEVMKVTYGGRMRELLSQLRSGLKVIDNASGPDGGYWINALGLAVLAAWEATRPKPPTPPSPEAP